MLKHKTKGDVTVYGSTKHHEPDSNNYQTKFMNPANQIKVDLPRFPSSFYYLSFESQSGVELSVTAYFTIGAGASKDGPVRFERSLGFHTKKEAFTDVFESPLIRAKQKEDEKLNELGTGDMNQVKL